MKKPDALSLFPFEKPPFHQCLTRIFHAGAIPLSDRRGVTLLELLTVMAILAVLAVLGGIGIMRGMPERRLMSASRDLYCGLRRAQAQAVTRGDLITVSFSPEEDRFSMTDSAGRLISRITFPGYIDLYDVTGDTEAENHYFFNPLGIKTGVSGSVCLRYRKPGYDFRRVMVRPTGSMTIQRSGDKGNTWG